MSRHATAVLAAALALAAPGTALAQSAGDDQYVDPFAGPQGQERDRSGSGGSQDPPAPATPAPATTQAPDPAPAAPGAEPVATTAGELPRTGSDGAWLAAIGVLLVAAGLRLRRTATA